MDTKSLITKLHYVAKTVDFAITTILADQIIDPVLSTVRTRLRHGILPNAKPPRNQQTKGLLRYCQESDQIAML